MVIIEDRLILGLLEIHHCYSNISSEWLDLRYDMANFNTFIYKTLAITSFLIIVMLYLLL